MTARRALTILAAATAVTAAGIALPATAFSAPTDTYLVNCAGKLVTKPSSITITCADAGVSINNITWRSWNENAAKGRGTLAWNTCLPQTCVDGIVEKYRVRITLGGVASGPGGTVFSQVQLTFPKGGPASLETGSYTIDNKIN